MEKQEGESSFFDYLYPLNIKNAIFYFFVIGFLVYFNSLFNGFVWDDWTNFLYNPHISDFSLNRIFGSNAFNTGIYYRPFAMLYLALFFKIFSTEVFFYHFFQLLFHIGSVCLLFYLFKKFINKNLAFFLALIFLIHPIQVESVVWISDILVPLSFFFGILALVLSISKKQTPLILLTTFFALFISVFVRETGFIFFILIIYLQFFYLKRKFINLLLIQFIIGVIYLILRFGYGKVFFDYDFFTPFIDSSFTEKALNTPAVFFYYIKTIIFPLNLAINQLWVVKNLDLFNFFLPIGAILIFVCFIIGVVLWTKKNNKSQFVILSFFLLWFIFGILSLSPFTPLDLTVADRYFYFPLAGLLGVIGVFCNSLKIQNKNYKYLIGIMLTIIVVLLSFRTIVRNDNWKSYFNLVKHDIQIENNFNMQTMYGMLLVFENKDYKSALPYFLKSVEMFPHESNLKNLGSTYLELGEKDKAQEYFYKALEGRNFSSRKTHNKSTYDALTNLLFSNRDFIEVKKIAAQGIREHPEHFRLYVLLAISEYELNNQEAALKAAYEAYKLSPNDQTRFLYTKIKSGEPLEYNFVQ